MKILAPFLLVAASMYAQTSVIPSGPWPICEPVGLPGNPFCIGFVPGLESYHILIIAPDSKASAYQWRVSATVNGVRVTRVGIVIRNDSTTGWPAPGATFDVIWFGGVASDIKVEEVRELGVIGVLASSV